MKNLEKRISELLTTAKGEVRKDAELTLKLLQYGGRIYPCYYSGKGRFSTKAGGTCKTEHYLTKLGIDYTLGNDSPRDGWSGNYIELSKKGEKQVSKYRAEIKAKNEVEKLAAEKLAAEQKQQHLDLLASLPEKFKFETLWYNVEGKNISGLSWSSYRDSLKKQYPSDWQILKAKFKAMQAIKNT